MKNESAWPVGRIVIAGVGSSALAFLAGCLLGTLGGWHVEFPAHDHAEASKLVACAREGSTLHCYDFVRFANYLFERQEQERENAEAAEHADPNNL